MDIAYVHFGEWGGPYRTVMADGIARDNVCRRNPYKSGYGRKIPSPYSVLFRSRWRRIYITSYSNAGTPWIYVDGVETVVDVHFGSH